MPDLDPERLGLAEELQRVYAAEGTLTPAQARAFVRGLQRGWRVPTIQWEDAESRTQLADAKRLLNAAEIFSSIEGDPSNGAAFCYRRAAEILEWLARADDDLETFVPLELLSAAAYQLGGLPAMASALLSQQAQNSPGERLYARFLKAGFDDVLQAVAEFWQDHFDLSDRDAPARVLAEDGEDKISWYLTVELVRVLGALADALRRGETERFNLVLRKLDALDGLALRTLNDDASLLVTLLAKVARAYGKTSIYGPIRRLSELNPARSGRLEKYARGQFSRGRGILWTSQIQGLSRLLDEDSFALCTPTGSGKTLVANLALVKELLLRVGEDDGPLALYLVPSRALAGEVELKLSRELGDDFIVTGLYGGTDWGVTDYWIEADRPTVLIATVEKADALMRYLGPLLIRRLRLLVVDEAHQVVPENSERTQADFAEHSSRSLRLEAFVSRLLAQAPGIVRIALTAVAGGAAPPVARWIEGREEAEAIGTNYRSTRQIIGAFETSPNSAGRMLLEVLNGKPLFVRGRDKPVYISMRTPSMPQLPAKMRNSIYRFNELDVLWTALHLASGGRRILISLAQQPEKTMGWYKEALALFDWQETLTFTQPEDADDRACFEEARAACIDYCGEDSYEIALLDRGIASNHGQMPQRLRRLMVDLIDRSICPVTVATATLTEGVNLPFDMIFVTALKRRSFDPVNNQPIVSPMSTAEFRNLAGRAGRPGAGQGMEGITLVALPRRPAATAPKAIPRQRNQIAEMREEYRGLRQSLLAEELEQVDVESPLALLLNGIAERALELFGISGEGLLEWLEAAAPPDISDQAGQASSDDAARLADSVDELDGVLLSALEELKRIRDDDLEGGDAEAALVELWRRTFTAYAAAQEGWMEHAFVRRGAALLEDLYPDEDERTRLYQYGFTPHVGRRFEQISPTILERLQDAGGYGLFHPEERLAVFADLGEFLVNDRGYGFRVRDTQTDKNILENWQTVLRWWMQGPDAVPPAPDQLRSWQRFVTDNLEFRLGLTVGAVVAHAWSDGAGDPLAVPSLEEWQDTTGLPWFGFWARELVRWGTLDPFVAFALSQGLARTRGDAAEIRQQFEAWLEENRADIVADDHIDPQLFVEWQRAIPQPERPPATDNTVAVSLSGSTGQRGLYKVIPVLSEDQVHWFDAAGYRLAQSARAQSPISGRIYRDDFELGTADAGPVVRRSYAWSAA